jgi:FG-GAP repeat
LVFTLDTAAAAPNLALATDSGSSSSDFITNTRTVNVTGLETGATWEFSLNGGSTWSVGTGTSFTTAANATYAASAIQVRQTDTAGNTSTAAGNPQTWVVDTTAPAPTFAAGNNVRSTEVGSAYLVLSSAPVTSLSDILALPSSQWNSVAITSANTNTLLPRGGLGTGSYVLYSIDTAGNLSAPSAARAVTNPVLSVSVLLSANLGFRIQGKDVQDGAGVSVYGVGDVNGDGLDDVLVGAPFASAGNGDGQAYVVFGKPNSNTLDVNLGGVVSGTGGFAINAATAGGLSGAAVSGIGDINGDGLADLIVGAPGDHANAGTSYVVFGQSSTSAVNLSSISNGAGGFRITNASGAMNSGSALSSAGDFNRDGFTDFIVATPGPVLNGATPTSGDVFLVYGTSSFQDIDLSAIEAGNGGFKLTGTGTQQLGFSVSSAGDLNGDGYSDIVMGAPNDNAGAGKVFVKYGGPAANNGGFEITGLTQSRLGSSVSGGGDVNGDGYADLIIGAPQRNPQTQVFSGPGKAYVVFGGATHSNINVSAIEAQTGGFAIYGANANSQAGISVSFVGDINGDGLSEMIVGEDLATVNGRAQAGNTYVVFGKTSTTAVQLSDVAKGIDGFIVAGSNANDRNGWSLSAAGDIDGDGLADLVIGAKGESLDGTTVGAGQAFVIFGNAAGTYYETNVDQRAVAGGSTLTSTGGQSLLGGVGNDTLVSAGADVLYGGRGNDSFVLKSAMVTALSQGFNATTQTLARVSGGTGIDTLRLADGVTLDLTAIANTGYGLDVNGSGGSRIQSIEVIDMKTDTAANTTHLRLSDVLDMSGMNLFNSGNTALVSGTALAASVAKHQVAIYGDALDTLNLGPANGWSNSGNVVSYNGHNLVVYNNTNTTVQLLIDQAMVDAGRVM